MFLKTSYLSKLGENMAADPMMAQKSAFIMGVASACDAVLDLRDEFDPETEG